MQICIHYNTVNKRDIGYGFLLYYFNNKVKNVTKNIFIVLWFLGTPSNIDKYTSKCVPANFGAFIRHVSKTSKIDANSLYYKCC